MNDIIVFAQGRSQPYGFYGHEQLDIVVKSIIILLCITALVVFIITLTKYVRSRNKNNKSTKRMVALVVISAAIFVASMLLMLGTILD